MNDVFLQSLESAGDDYLAAEGRLREGGDEAREVLRSHFDDEDRVARHLARVVDDWIERRPEDYEEALAFLLVGAEARAGQTPIGKPSPLGIAAYLSRDFEDRLVGLLALRLLKGSDWPHWRVSGVIFYLEEPKRPAATAPLARFAAETSREEWRGYAIEALEAIGDPELAAILDAEKARLEALDGELPASLVTLRARQ